ncbi:MAG: HD domain-containing protein [Candidatus Brockarchaeota archaeon]|nr:HD domain-containing protein [Candidatus Brockarchaeota archaeon]
MPEFVGEIRDPLYKYVNFTEPEKLLIDSPPVQRLRRIKQLAGAHLTYASGEHSRFPHVLGVMHLAGKLGKKLLDGNRIGKDDWQKLRIAALLHDVGHGPFSHTYEEVLYKYRKATHEDVSRWLILNTELKDIVSRSGFSPDEICELLVGSAASGKSKLLNQAISGHFDVDMMDYLVRDSHHTGVEYGYVDVERLIDSIVVVGETLAMNVNAMVALESFFIARYMMFKAVYFHRTVRAAEIMVCKAMDLANEALGLTDFKEPEEFLRLDDQSVVSGIMSLEGGGKLKYAKEMVGMYNERRLLKAVFETFLHHEHKLYPTLLGRFDIRERLAEEMAEMAGVDPEYVIIDVPTVPSLPYRPLHGKSETEIQVAVERSPNSYEMRSIFDLSPVVSSLKGFLDVARVYTVAEHRNKIQAAARSVFGEPPAAHRVSY